MAKIYRVIRIKLSQFKKMSIWSLTYQQSVFNRYLSDKHFSVFYLQDGNKNQLAYMWNKITSMLPYAYAPHRLYIWQHLCLWHEPFCFQTSDDKQTQTNTDKVTDASAVLVGHVRNHPVRITDNDMCSFFLFLFNTLFTSIASPPEWFVSD